MIRVLFLCTGNICRSAYAERRARHLAPDLDVVSAGTHAMRGWGVDESMAVELEARGGSAADFSAQQLTESLARSAGLILCATREHREYVTDAWPDLEPRTFVMKSYARALADSGLGAWSPVPASETSSLTRSDDIADPYRMGQPDATRAADEIDAILAQIIGAPATD